jgi:hypothetical protein
MLPIFRQRTCFIALLDVIANVCLLPNSQTKPKIRHIHVLCIINKSLNEHIFLNIRPNRR